MRDLATIVAMNAKAMAEHKKKKVQKLKQLSVCEMFHARSKKEIKKSILLRLFPKSTGKILFVIANRWPWGRGYYTCRDSFKQSLLIDIRYVLPSATGRFSKLRDRIDMWVAKKVIQSLVKYWWPKGGKLTTLSDLGKT